MSIIINTEKVWKDGKQCRRIVNFKALKLEELPEEYHEKDTGPACFINCDNELVVWSKVLTSPGYLVEKDTIMTEEDFQKMLNLVKKAGTRLMKIKKMLQQEKERQWSGKQRFVI